MVIVAPRGYSRKNMLLVGQILDESWVPCPSQIWRLVSFVWGIVDALEWGTDLDACDSVLESSLYLGLELCTAVVGVGEGHRGWPRS